MFTAIVVLTSIFTALAGASDGGNLLAAASAGRVVSPAAAFAIILAGVAAGPLVVGTAVAATIGRGIADYPAVGGAALAAGVGGAVGALLIAYAARVPTSTSVALVGSMVGALWAGPGIGAVHWPGVATVAIALVCAPLVGFAAGALAYALALAALARATRRSGERAMRLQYVAVALQAVGYGANDAEKSIGLFAVAAALQSGQHAAVNLGSVGGGAIPVWAMALTTATFAAGMIVGGVRIARIVGGKLFAIRPAHALAFQSAAASTVIVASLLGAPLSTTQTTACAMLGVGASENPRALHWPAAVRIVASWFLTIPVALALGALASSLLRLFGV